MLTTLAAVCALALFAASLPARATPPPIKVYLFVGQSILGWSILSNDFKTCDALIPEDRAVWEPALVTVRTALMQFAHNDPHAASKWIDIDDIARPTSMPAGAHGHPPVPSSSCSSPLLCFSCRRCWPLPGLAFVHDIRCPNECQLTNWY